MDAHEVVGLYDEDYAKAYDDTFIHNEHYRHVAAFELEVLSHILPNPGKWLDVGCGTGYFMSKFPGVPRAGLDLSESMLRVARGRNLDALFLRQGDFRVQRPEWNGQWELVSCMWCAYCYVESMTEIDRVIRNLSDWTSNAGVCFLPICDLEDVLFQRAELKHHISDEQIFAGSGYVNAVTWTFIDTLNNKRHDNLISPHIEYLTKRLQESFAMVEVIYYPPFPYPIPGQRKALLATRQPDALTAAGKAGLLTIRERSRVNRESVLTMEKLEERSRAVPTYRGEASVQGEEAASGKVGWMRRAWRGLPGSVQAMVRRLIGEG